ncbi:prostate stem cell antigen [Ornithorhynchus anatinus]|uniref:Prostate stem cell antigen n=1 Tax=Ornithorhynchus anatinus TaxID=9258 RepID=A0A6I8PR13_ORNAN|nr:prostate stem cell antigen [Ornithorhynchus anatinus]
MRALLVVLLVTTLAVGPGGSLQCYKCTGQTNNKNCQTVQPCRHEEKVCKTELTTAAGLVRFITKSCVESCQEETNNYHVGFRNVTCCRSDLCNVNGARGLSPSPAAILSASLLGLFGALLRTPL